VKIYNLVEKDTGLILVKNYVIEEGESFFLQEKGKVFPNFMNEAIYPVVFSEKDVSHIVDQSNSKEEGEMNSFVCKQIKENINNFINVLNIFKSNYSLLSKFFIEKSRKITETN
jgi:hypothetical protein